MKILFINNHGGGFAAPLEIAEGTNIATLFCEQMPGEKPQDFLIRVDRQAATANQVLHEGARVSFTPVKIEGALVAA